MGTREKRAGGEDRGKSCSRLPSIDLAGAHAAPHRVWLEDWSMQGSPEQPFPLRLRASQDDVAIDLTLETAKPLVLQGDRGLDRKGPGPGNASYYYSITRLATSGSLRLHDREFAVSGLSWLDREWGSSALSKQQVGWDWFALQLSDGSDLMFYNLRRNDGSQDEFSAGTFTAATGDYEYIARSELTVEVVEHWQSERGGRYPSAWSISIPGKQLRLDIVPVLANQELATMVRYWEGAVDVRGSLAGRTIEGRGYVELTGYGE